MKFIENLEQFCGGFAAGVTFHLLTRTGEPPTGVCGLPADTIARSSSLALSFFFSNMKIRPCVLPGNTFALTSSVFFSVRGQAEKKHLFSQLELSFMNKYVNICVGLLGRFIAAVQRSSGVEVSACISLNSLDAAAAYDDDDDDDDAAAAVAADNVADDDNTTS